MTNLVVISGSLAKDPEFSSVGANGTHLCKLTIAVSRGEGEKKKTSYIDCEAWTKTADAIDESGASKGDTFTVTDGMLDMQSWEDKTTKQKRSKLVVVIHDFACGMRKRVGNAPANTATTSAASPGYDDSSLPF